MPLPLQLVAWRSCVDHTLQSDDSWGQCKKMDVWMKELATPKAWDMFFGAEVMALIKWSNELSHTAVAKGMLQSWDMKGSCEKDITRYLQRSATQVFSHLQQGQFQKMPKRSKRRTVSWEVSVSDQFQAWHDLPGLRCPTFWGNQPIQPGTACSASCWAVARQNWNKIHLFGVVENCGPQAKWMVFYLVLTVV